MTPPSKPSCRTSTLRARRAAPAFSLTPQAHPNRRCRRYWKCAGQVFAFCEHRIGPNRGVAGTGSAPARHCRNAGPTSHHTMRQAANPCAASFRTGDREAPADNGVARNPLGNCWCPPTEICGGSVTFWRFGVGQPPSAGIRQPAAGSDHSDWRRAHRTRFGRLPRSFRCRRLGIRRSRTGGLCAAARPLWQAAPLERGNLERRGVERAQLRGSA